ncbi:hypothetical protein IKF32_03040 [Candidatus Saccharibacteria bacterium]|nr:hypothetical protein [Candidatus Saccharibacteria bacterium]
MDPMNNPTPTPNPVPNPVPSPEPGPIAGVGANPVQPANNAAPVSPAMPAAPAQPVVLSAPTINPPAPTQSVNPVVNPVSPAPANPAFKPAGVGMAATDPIMMPEQPKAPDPIEEELKAPMKAAAPVPGSIGSAVSGPAEMPAAQPAGNEQVVNTFAQSQTPNVSFTDPAMQPDVNANPAVAAQPVKKKSSKSTLIALIVVALIIILALVGVFVFQFLEPGTNNSGSGGSGSNSNSNSSSNSSNSSTINPNSNSTQEDYGGGVTDNTANSTESGTTTKANYTVSCSAKTTADSGEMTTKIYVALVKNSKFYSFTFSEIVDNPTTNETTKSDPTTIEYEEFLSKYYPTTYKDDFDTNKTLSIIPSVFSTRLQEGLNSGSTIKFTCEAD